MMASRIALCVDRETCCNPALIGLDGESLESQEWLDVFSCGADARQAIRSSADIGQAWVVSAEDVEPINLAATIKADRPELRVSLVEFEGCGSLFSRAHTALIDEVADRNVFVRRYAEAKQAYADLASAGKGGPSSGQRAEGATSSGGLGSTAFPDGPENAIPEGGGRQPAVGQPAAADGSAEARQAVAGDQPQSSSQELAADRPQSINQAPVADRPSNAGDGAPADMTWEAPSSRTLSSVAASRRAFVMPIVSGSGGAGKSSVAAIGACISAALGYKTLLLDYDLQFGDVAEMVGVENALSIDEAMLHAEQLEREVNREGGLSVLAAPRRLEMAEAIVREMPGFLDALAGSFDVIIANTGAAWAEQHAVLLERSSAALFLVDQRASSVRACKHALELCARCGIASGPFQFAVNRCSKNAPLSSIDVSCALQGAPVFELRDGGRDVEDFLSGGAATDLLAQGNGFCASLEQVLIRLLPGSAQQSSEKPPLAEERRLSKRRGRHVNRRRGRGAQ